MTDSNLARLADLAGVEIGYRDGFGRWREPSREALCALLEALAIPASTETDIAQSLARLNETRLRERLPPVIVARTGAEIAIPLRLTSPDRLGAWIIKYESGVQAEGIFDPCDLATGSENELTGKNIVARYLVLGPQPSGAHRLHISCGTEEASSTLIVTPEQCHLPDDWPGQRYWGIATQLYSVRSDDNLGIGDFGDLAHLVEWSAATGADLVGVNPLHALFLDSPEDASPYSPNSRLFLNPLYLAIASIPEWSQRAEAHEFRDAGIGAGPTATRQPDLISYRKVASIKLPLLERLFGQFETAAPEPRRAAFAAYAEGQGRPLNNFAVFQVLAERLGTHVWQEWPEDMRDPRSNAVATFAQGNQERVAYHKYLQWLCDDQLGTAAKACAHRGMRLGLYKDLAVSVAAASADHWAHQRTFVPGMRVGAPADPFNEAGQEWGLVPLHPHRLRQDAYAHFFALLRANMRHAGALRIDHVMGLKRLFVIPAGGRPSDGAYLRYPLDDLTAIVALESARNKCAVIGEDLGTVPDGFRERMASANILSSRILYFEGGQQRFTKPEDFPALACISAATHDLATLRGYWTMADIDAKAKLGIFSSPGEADDLRSQREFDRQALLRSLVEEGLWPTGEAAATPAWSRDLGAAIHTYLARSSAKVLLVQLDDLADEPQQANLPGTTGEYPNWRRRLHRSLSALRADLPLAQALGGIDRERRARGQVPL